MPVWCAWYMGESLRGLPPQGLRQHLVAVGALGVSSVTIFSKSSIISIEVLIEVRGP